MSPSKVSPSQGVLAEMPAKARHQAGFTIIELLIASTLSLVVAGLMISMITSTGKMQQRNTAQVSVDDAMRASLELMSQDLREATETRVLYNPPSSTLNSWLTSSSALTVTTVSPLNTFSLTAPVGYPAVTNYTPLSAPITTPNSSTPPNTCAGAINGGDFLLAANGASNTPIWLQAAAVPCVGSNVLLSGLGWTGQPFVFNPTATIGKVLITRYWVDGPTQTLVRQIFGSASQVVAYNISSLNVEYTTDGTIWKPTASGAPKAVRLTLGGQRTIGKQTSSLSLSSTVFMRDLATPAQGTTP